MSPSYHRLALVATSPSTEIWLGDDEGYFVERATGVLETSVEAGDYTVEFGLGSTTYPIVLRGPLSRSQAEIVAGPSCPRPLPPI